MLGVAGLVTACANPYETHYRPMTASQINQPEQFSGEPRLRSSGAKTGLEEVNRMFQEGYGLIGVSGFVGEARSDSLAIDQAKKVGAAVVVVHHKYRNTETHTSSIVVPDIKSVDTSGTVSGPGGSGYFSGSSTVYGTRTESSTQSVDNYEQVALYFVPLQRTGAGVLLNNMTDEQKRANETNRGVAVSAVRQGSPAYEADIVPGDILVSIGDHKVFDRASSITALTSTRGRPATYVLLRNGRRVEKTLTVPAGTW